MFDFEIVPLGNSTREPARSHPNRSESRDSIRCQDIAPAVPAIRSVPVAFVRSAISARRRSLAGSAPGSSREIQLAIADCHECGTRASDTASRDPVLDSEIPSRILS